MKKLKVFILACLLISNAYSQDIYVFHGKNGQTKFLNSKMEMVNKYVLKKHKGETFTIMVLNANPLFYEYKVTYEAIETQSESKEITDALTLLGTALSNRVVPAGGGFAPDTQFDLYKAAVEQLKTDIGTAATFINNSDQPEPFTIAPVFAIGTGGITKAQADVLAISSAKNRFNDPALLANLNLLSNAIAIDDPLKQALGLLNESLVQKVNSIKKSIATANILFQSEFTVADKTTKVHLAISQLDPAKGGAREFHTGSSNLEAVTIIPYYDRATLELIPVGNFLFSSNTSEFYLENNIIKSREKTKTTFHPGVVINANFARFGETREMAAGLGLGYKFSSDAKALESLYISSLFSYKNFLRVGFGFGFSNFPEGLKGGAVVNGNLPANIKNLDDVIEYREKPTFFMTIAFAGLNLTKKK